MVHAGSRGDVDLSEVDPGDDVAGTTTGLVAPASRRTGESATSAATTTAPATTARGNLNGQCMV